MKEEVGNRKLNKDKVGRKPEDPVLRDHRQGKPMLKHSELSKARMEVRFVELSIKFQKAPTEMESLYSREE